MNRIVSASHSNPFAELEANEEEDWNIDYNLRNLDNNIVERNQIFNNNTDINVKNYGTLNERPPIQNITENDNNERPTNQNITENDNNGRGLNERAQLINNSEIDYNNDRNNNGATFERGLVYGSKEGSSYEGFYMRESEEVNKSNLNLFSNHNRNANAIQNNNGNVFNQGNNSQYDTIQQSEEIRNVFVGKGAEAREENCLNNLNAVQDSHHKEFYPRNFSSNFSFNHNCTLISSNPPHVLQSYPLSNQIINEIALFPGPLKNESTNITFTKLFDFFNYKINSPEIKNLPNHPPSESTTENFPWETLTEKLCYLFLNEIILSKKINSFDLFKNDKTRQSFIDFIETHILPCFGNIDDFKHEASYLKDLMNLSKENRKYYIEENQWELLFFSDFFLAARNSDSFSKECREMVQEYVNRSFKPFFPVSFLSSVKLRNLGVLYGDSEERIAHYSILYFWFLLMVFEYVDLAIYNSFLEVLFYKCNDGRKTPFLQAFYLMMSLSFDNENIKLLVRENNGVRMVHILEAFFYLAGAISNYDPKKFVVKNMFPIYLVHGYNLIDFNFHEKALEYVNYVGESRSYFGELEHNLHFIVRLKDLRQRLIYNVERVCNFKNCQVNFVGNLPEDSKHIKNVKSEKDMEVEERKDFGKNLKRNLFSYFNSAIDLIKNNSISAGNEKPKNSGSSTNKDFYYDEKLKTWIINGQPAQEESDIGGGGRREKKETEKSVTPPLPPPPPPIAPPSFPPTFLKKEDSLIKEEKKNIPEVPKVVVTSKPFGTPFSENPPPNNKAGNNKRVLQNRYVEFK